MIAYFDASALVKLLVEEPGSDQAAALWDGADAVLSSRIAYAEVRAAVAAAHRAGRLTDGQSQEAKRSWADLWEALRVVEVSAELGELAGDLAEAHALSGSDAIHLASTLLVSRDELVVATWDRRLHAAVQSAGLAGLPARL